MTTLFTVNYSGGYGYLYEFMAQATEETYSIVDNTSRVTVYTYLRRNKLSSNGAYNLNGTAWKITIDGEEFSGTEKWDTRNTTDWQIIGAATKIISHNPDGSKIITISASHIGNSASGSSKMGDASGSGTFELTKIPRASTIKATDANIGSPSSIYITPADSSFTHTITYSFGSLSGTVVNKTQQSPYPFTLPTSFYKEIPNDPYGVVTLTCTTYSGDTAVGTSQTTFKAYVPEEDNKPKLSATIVDTNSKTTALTGNSAVLVKNRSTAKVTVTATAQNSAKIKSITVNGKTTSDNIATFTNVTDTKFEIIARDSRGFPKTLNKVAGTDFTMIDYLPLTLNAKFYRVSATSSEVKVKYDGKYFNGNFSSTKGNTLTVTWAYKLKEAANYTPGGTLAPTKSGNTYKGEVSLGTTFDYQKAYDFIIYASDKLTSLNVPQPIQKGEPIYDYGVDRNGNNYLFVNGNLYAKGNLQVYRNGEINEIDFENLQLKPTTLYNNSSGTVGTVTLSETSANFSYLEIFFGVHGGGWSMNSVKVSSPNGKQCSLSAVTFDNSDSSNLAYINNAKLMKISGTNITVDSYERMFKYYKDSNVYIDTENNIYIYKVIGYR